MARTITVTGIEWREIRIVNIPSEGSADIVVDYFAIMNDGSRQPRQWLLKVNTVIPDQATTPAQAKTALERILGYGIEQMEGLEDLNP